MRSTELRRPSSEQIGARGDSGVGLEAWGEPRLVEAAIAGSVEAFGELYRRRRGFVRAVLLARLAPDEAEDEVQEVFVVAWERLAGLGDAQRLGPWLAAIARRRCSRWRRRRDVDPVRRPQGFGEGSEPSGSDPDPAGVELADRVLAEIRRLPAGTAEVLQLSLLEDRSPAEIAAELGRTPGAVRVALHKGLARLRERLQEDDT